jgi:hypothetical protein
VKKVDEEMSEQDCPYSSVNFKMKYNNEKMQIFCAKKNIEFQGRKNGFWFNK